MPLAQGGGSEAVQLPACLSTCLQGRFPMEDLVRVLVTVGLDVWVAEALASEAEGGSDLLRFLPEPRTPPDTGQVPLPFPLVFFFLRSSLTRPPSGFIFAGAAGRPTARRPPPLPGSTSMARWTSWPRTRSLRGRGTARWGGRC